MKAQKKLNIVLIVLIVLLLSLISFVGIFYQDKNQMVSRLPEYKLGTDLTGYRKVTLEIKEETEAADETDATEDNVVDEENATEENTTTENTTENATAEKTAEEKAADYRKSASIIRARLKNLKVSDFTVTCDENTGKIEITIEENDQTDTILSDITQKGNFKIEDSETGEVLLTNEDIKNVDVEKKAATASNTTVYMNINFNLKGTSKFKNVTQTYHNVVAENTTTENTTTETATEENTTAENTTTETDVTKAKEVNLKIDDSTMMTTSFDTIIDNGVLPLTIGQSSDNAEIKNNLYGGYNLAAIMENDAMPLQYEITGNTYYASTMEENNIKILVYIEIGISLLIALFMVIKFRLNGVLTLITSIGYIAILLIAIRYANVVLSLEGMLAIVISYVVNSIFNFMLCGKIKDKSLSKETKIKRYNDTMKKFSMGLIPLTILAVVCCFINWNSIFSFGMVTFWGIIISLLYNLTMTNILVRSINK